MKRLFVVSLFVGSTLFAMPPHPPKFSDFDTNSDGKITQVEFEEAHSKHMQKMAEEGRPMRNAGNAPQFSDIDTNGDGVITPEEFKKHHQKRMEKRKGDRPAPGMGYRGGMGGM